MERLCPTERDALIIRVLGDTGIRVGELCTLHIDDCIVRHERRTFLKVCGKGRNERLVPIDPTLVRRIQHYASMRPADTLQPELFLTLRRSQYGAYVGLDKNSVLHVVRGAAQRAGITKRVHPHLFRHGFATEALRRGMSPIQLARILGHTSLAMIERTYSHLNRDDDYEAVVRMLNGR